MKYKLDLDRWSVKLFLNLYNMQRVKVVSESIIFRIWIKYAYLTSLSIQMGQVCISFNEVFSWWDTVSSNIIFKTYPEDAIQFFKWLANPFQPSIAFFQPLKTSNLKYVWCF